MRLRLLAVVCLVIAVLSWAGARKLRRVAQHHSVAASPYAVATVEAAPPLPQPPAEPPKTVFRLRCTSAELPSLSDGATVRPELAPPGLVAKVVSRGHGEIKLQKPSGCSFTQGGQQARDTAYLQFSGPAVGALFDTSTPGAVSFTATSRISFAERVAEPNRGRPFRHALDVYDEFSGQMGINITPHDGLLAISYSVAKGPGVYYFFPKGDEEKVFGKGVSMKIRLAWDGRETSHLFINDKLVDTKPYGRGKPEWSAKASFAIGARDQHEYGGGFFSFDDILADFTVASSGPFKDTAAPDLTLRYPAAGQKISGAAILAADASDNEGVAKVKFLLDGAPVATLLSYPYRAFWDSRAVPPGAHKLTVEAADAAGNTAKKEVAIVVEPPAAADREPPSSVASLYTKELRPNSIAIAWMPSVDNVGVAEYRVYRDGSPVGAVKVDGVQKEQTVAYTDSSATAGRAYRYQVEAVDAAGNAAPLSAPITLTAPAVAGAVLHVGPGRQYAMPCAAIAAAKPGDTVEIDAAGNGAYDGDVCAWTTDNLTIRGVNGRPRIDSRGRVAAGRGVWVIGGRGNTVENVEISGATSMDRNGSAIRYEGQDLTLRHVYFHHNQDGILATPAAKGVGTLLIEFCEFAYDGAGDGQSHNLYINEVGRLIFRYNYSHHGNIGHLLKSRAHENVILYNRFTDETGTASYEINLPNGGPAYIVGNILQQSAKGDNDIFISAGEEGPRAGLRHVMYVVNNTFVNEMGKGRFFNVSGVRVVAVNNLLAGPGTAFDLPPGSTSKNNLTADPGFLNPQARDYRLKAGSAGRAAAADPGPAPEGAPELLPRYQYMHPTGAIELRPGSKLNLGALQ